MTLLTRLHGRLVPPGREVDILRKLPLVTLVGSAITAANSIIVRLLPGSAGTDAAKHVMTVDIFTIASTITFWVAMGTIAIGCVVVHVMKGPAYVADAYAVEHADRPAAVISDS